ncbi:MAG: 50S ribosomal protein L15 [Verrucomicrobia bacterium]|nr:50S ribosomal protein L15 [Verrucomicrobiota bacterium]MBU1909804.1 50S ribosomal protein L15 [Verrucomicrobiota bacterium]
MTLSNLSNTPGARHRPIRVGRGRSSGKGKTSGKGHKGQMSRTGHKRKPTFEGGQMRLVRRMPKRGFTGGRHGRFIPVNVGALDRFPDGAVVNVDALCEARLAHRGPGVRGVKVLGTGKLAKKLTVQVQAFSASARARIEASGGICEAVPFK